jgi:hypothetical protein
VDGGEVLIWQQCLRNRCDAKALRVAFDWAIRNHFPRL